MAKLYFRYGTVSSAKTLNLLAVRHNYLTQNKIVLLFKPKLDTRTQDIVYSRCGLQANTDLLIDEKTNIVEFVDNFVLKIQNKKEKSSKDEVGTNTESKQDSINHAYISCILVDEVQFLSKENIVQLRFIASFYKIPVITYGLRTNFYGKLFKGSEALMALADTIEEVKNTCHYCNRKAVMNLKIVNDGNSNEINLGFEDKYLPTCYKHFFTLTEYDME
jgi:thymidine kinase